MRVKKDLLTPSQRARVERDERICEMYETAMAADQKPTLVAVCDHIADIVGVSKTTVYNIIRDAYGNGQATNDDDGE